MNKFINSQHISHETLPLRFTAKNITIQNFEQQRKNGCIKILGEKNSLPFSRIINKGKLNDLSQKNYKNPSDFLFSFFNLFFSLFFPMVFVCSGSAGEEPDMAAFMRGRKWGARKGLAPPPSPVQGRGVGGAPLLEVSGVFSETLKLGRLDVLLVTGPIVKNLVSVGNLLFLFQDYVK